MQAQILAVFGISREVYGRALKNLEATGLVTVERRKGQTPLVTVLSVE